MAGKVDYRHMPMTEKAAQCKVIKKYSGKFHFFDVESPTKEKYSVILKIMCDCEHHSVQGEPNGTICAHILAVMAKIVKEGKI